MRKPNLCNFRNFESSTQVLEIWDIGTNKFQPDNQHFVGLPITAIFLKSVRVASCRGLNPSVAQFARVSCWQRSFVSIFYWESEAAAVSLFFRRSLQMKTLNAKFGGRRGAAQRGVFCEGGGQRTAEGPLGGGRLRMPAARPPRPVQPTQRSENWLPVNIGQRSSLGKDGDCPTRGECTGLECVTFRPQVERSGEGARHKTRKTLKSGLLNSLDRLSCAF